MEHSKNKVYVGLKTPTLFLKKVVADSYPISKLKPTKPKSLKFTDLSDRDLLELSSPTWENHQS